MSPNGRGLNLLIDSCRLTQRDERVEQITCVNDNDGRS